VVKTIQDLTGRQWTGGVGYHGKPSKKKGVTHPRPKSFWHTIIPYPGCSLEGIERTKRRGKNVPIPRTNQFLVFFT